MTKETGFGCMLWIGAIVLVIVGLYFAFQIGSSVMSYFCTSHWPDDATRWSVAAGCQVQVDGRWVPENSVRVL
jgi:hypothetical protein